MFTKKFYSLLVAICALPSIGSATIYNDSEYVYLWGDELNQSDYKTPELFSYNFFTDPAANPLNAVQITLSSTWNVSVDAFGVYDGNIIDPPASIDASESINGMSLSLLEPSGVTFYQSSTGGSTSASCSAEYGDPPCVASNDNSGSWNNSWFITDPNDLAIFESSTLTEFGLSMDTKFDCSVSDLDLIICFDDDNDGIGSHGSWRGELSIAYYTGDDDPFPGDDNPLPVPAPLALMGLGLAAISVSRRKARQ